MSKLKIGLLLDSESIDAYVRELLDWAGRQDNLEISAVLVCRPAPARGGNLLRMLAGLAPRLAFDLVIGAERRLLRLYKPHREHLSSFSLGEVAPNLRVAHVRLSGAADAGLAQAELERAGVPPLDLLVGAGSRAAAQQLAGAAALGAVMLDYHGKRAGRMAPPGFWEAYSKAPKTAFEIAQAGSHGATGHTLVSGSFPTKFLFLLNQAHLYRQANAQLKGLLEAVAASRRLPAPQSARPYSGRYRGQPGLRHSAAYLAKIASRLGAKAFLRLFNIREKWGLSCIYANWKDVALWNSFRISAPRGHFWADPFLCSHDGKTYCFVEDYVYKTSRGHIAVLEITGQGARLLGDCIREGFHMSFPFLFRYQGELYMCPESSQARQVRQYRCKSFPLEWELHWVAMDGISAADTMFFEHGGKWWMLTNIDRSGLNDHCFELCLFHAGSPFDPHWTAHPQNPLRIDPDGGRNAGLILEDGRIFRAAQRQGFDQYGKGLMLYEILELTEDRYTERLVSEIDCNFRPGLLGSHHVSTTGKVTVFDHVGRTFFP